MNRAKSILILSSAFIIFAAADSKAQQGGELAPPSDPISDMTQTLSAVDLLIESSEASQIVDQAERVTTESVDSSDIEAWEQAQKSSHTRVSGLEFRAGYDRKFGSGTDEFYDDLYSYRNRFDAMLSWNILSSGLIGRASNEELVELEGHKLLLSELSLLNREQIRAQSQLQEQVLDSYLNMVYTTQIEIYESLRALLVKLQGQGQATAMELSQIEIQIQVAQGSIRTTPIEVEGLLNLSDYLSMQLMVDARMVESLVQSSTSVEQSRLNEAIVGNEHEGVSYWDRVSVSPYAKAQHYSDTGFGGSRIAAHVGVSATLPLFAGTKSKRAEVQARTALAANATTTATTSVSMLIEECAEQLNRDLERLATSIKLEELYRAQIKTARVAYEHNQLTMRELTQYYMELLTLQEDVIRMIGARESLKTKLLLTAI